MATIKNEINPYRTKAAVHLDMAITKQLCCNCKHSKSFGEEYFCYSIDMPIDVVKGKSPCKELRSDPTCPEYHRGLFKFNDVTSVLLALLFCGLVAVFMFVLTNSLS